MKYLNRHSVALQIVVLVLAEEVTIYNRRPFSRSLWVWGFL